MTLCNVCLKEEKKYKCPKCEILYCSVNCFKSHECQEYVIDTTGTTKEIIVEDNTEEKSYLIEVPEDFIIPPEKLEQLKHSEELRNALKNVHLRNFLKFAHETYNTSGFMKLAMNEPLFVEFADACLKVLHPENFAKKEITDQEIVEHIKEAIEETAK